MIEQANAGSASAGPNYQSNLQALRESQIDLATAVHADLSRCRLGAPARRLPNRGLAGRWWSGCSLPLRAAQSLLEKLDLSAAVSCFLSPMHAAQIRVTIDRLPAQRGLIAVVPEPQDPA